MDPILTPALITAGAGLLSNGVNAWSQHNTNEQQRKWAEAMYEREKADKLAQWHMENEYNSPAAQMARLRQGGLNPNLVYGKGADATGGNIAPTSSPSWNPTAPQFDFGSVASSGLDAYYNTAMKEAQIDNLKVQNTVYLQEAALKAASTANTVQSTARSKFDLELATELRQTSADMAREQLRKTSADANFQIDENERRAIAQDQSLKESAERILSMRLQRAHTRSDIERIKAQTKNILNNNEFQRLDLELRRLGISPNDPIYLRALGRAIGTNDYGDAWQKMDNWTREKSTDFKGWMDNFFK